MLVTYKRLVYVFFEVWEFVEEEERKIAEKKRDSKWFWFVF